MSNNIIDNGGGAFPLYCGAGNTANTIGMTLRDYFARNVPQDEVSEMTWKHLSLLAQEKLAGIKRPDKNNDLRGEENINQQIEMMLFHAKVTAALRYIAADAMIEARKLTTK
jgi:hypothetical protein